MTSLVRASLTSTGSIDKVIFVVLELWLYRRYSEFETSQFQTHCRPHITWLSTIQQDLKHHHLTLPEAADVAQNRPLWRMMSAYGATQSWVACQKRRRRRRVFTNYISSYLYIEKACEVTTSPTPLHHATFPVATNFSMSGQVTDIIDYSNFYLNWSKGYAPPRGGRNLPHSIDFMYRPYAV